MNPRRPHPYQISDREFSVQPGHGGTWVVLEWWRYIDKRGEKDYDDEVVASFNTEAEAMAERDRRAGR